jgi:adenylyltransferase/sulfurtransferase
VQISFPAGHDIDFDTVGRRLAAVGTVTRNAFLLRCAIAPYDLTLFRDGRAIIEGTREPSVARGLYAKYIGL